MQQTIYYLEKIFKKKNPNTHNEINFLNTWNDSPGIVLRPQFWRAKCFKLPIPSNASTSISEMILSDKVLKRKRNLFVNICLYNISKNKV